MTFKEAIAFMDRWRGSRLGLERMTELMERMGHPEKKLSYVHVAGTNGKGSTCAMLESVLYAAGMKTGMFTSPYLLTVLESIKIGGQQIAEADFCRAVEAVERAVNGDYAADDSAAEAMEDKPTEFEILTAAAIYAFAAAACDIVIMEVGMGGRLDSTNIIPPPLVSAITNLSLEHTQFLGDTLAKIAFEKAGIIKEGCHVVTYPVDAEAEEVYRTVAAERKAVWRRADMEAVSVPLRTDGSLADLPTVGQTFSWHEYRNLTLSLHGSQQIKNAVMVLEIVEELRERGWDIPEAAVRTGLAGVVWPARYEILRRKPPFICDGSHNPQCIRALRDNIREMLPDEKVTFLMGVLADKEYGEMLDCLIPHAKAFVCVTPMNPRALDAAGLAGLVRGVPAFAEKSIADGVRCALEIADGGPVIACGSLYIMGEIRKEFFKMADKERLNRLFGFALEIDKEKFIGRQTYLSDGKRKENDSEHAWHMAIMVWLLAEYANEKIDIARTMLMVLIHDLVEIDAGDTYAYDDAAKESQAEREKAAADRIFGMLPDDIGPKLRAVWEEFEAWETPEAKFARALDNFQPLMLNAATDGISWVEHGVRLSQVLKRNQRAKLGSEVLWEYAYHNFIEPNVEKGRIIDDLGDLKKDMI